MARPRFDNPLVGPLFARLYPAFIDTLPPLAPGDTIETWGFDDRATRLDAQAALARRGVTARCRSALKPLVCAFLEDIATDTLHEAQISVPTPAHAPAGRFLLEAYPLAEMMPHVAFRFCQHRDHAAIPAYHLRLRHTDRREERLEILAPNGISNSAHHHAQLSPCGWLVRNGAGMPLATSYEAILRDTVACVSALSDADLARLQRLNIRVTLPARDAPLGVDGEALSLIEAMHEELYFSLLEMFQARAGLAPGARDLRPGQIVPDVCYGPQYRLRIDAQRWTTADDTGPPAQPLTTATDALSARQISDQLGLIGGAPVSARSVAGRAVEGRHIAGRDRALILTAGQHANEVSGPVGALRAAHRIARAPGAHLLLCPMENPDGYALRAELAQHNPHHLLHAARYTALGDDLAYREDGPRYERAFRDAAYQMPGRLLHLSLHGYPAHEWLRPLSGYLPSGFESWSLPRGFFLIMRHRPEWRAPALRLLHAVATQLSQIPGLATLNTAQRARRRTYGATDSPDTMMVGTIACHLHSDPHLPLPMLLITEYPDETLTGPAFRAAHDTQCAAALAAYQALQTLGDHDWPADDAPTGGAIA